jgi:Ca2+-binding EF-hand superfamily protein
LNYLSKIIGGSICRRSDLDYIFEIIDENGDEYISINEFLIFINKFIEVLKNEQHEGYEKL